MSSENKGLGRNESAKLSDLIEDLRALLNLGFDRVELKNAIIYHKSGRVEELRFLVRPSQE